MKVIAIANQKGGVGKTTTVATLAQYLRERGHFVGLLDLDPQACLGLLATDVERIEPSDLARAIKRHAADDYVLIDTPPSLGEATDAATQAAHGVIIPTQPEFLALRGLGSLLAAIDVSKVIGLVVTGYRGHVTHHRRVLERLGELGHPILAVVPYTIAAADAGLAGKSLVSYGPARSRGVVAAYHQLAGRVEAWAQKTE